MKQTVTYLRVSTEDQTLDSQRIQLLPDCAARGWTIAREFSDVISGSKAKRPGLDSLLAACARGEIERIVVTKIDRVSRSTADFLALVARLDKMRVGIVCIQQSIDTGDESPSGKVMRTVFMAFAEFERDMIRERTRDGLAAARARGSQIGREMVAPVPDWKALFAAWKGDDYKELVPLLGVSKSTAWRLVKRRKAFVPQVPAAPSTPSTLAAEF